MNPAARDRHLPNPVAVIARDHDRISFGVDAGDDADMAAAAPPHDGNGADLRSRYALAVAGERIRHVGAGAAITGMLQHHVHEPRAPQPAAAGGIATEVTA